MLFIQSIVTNTRPSISKTKEKSTNNASTQMKYLYNEDSKLMSVMGKSKKFVNNKYASDCNDHKVYLFLTQQKVSQKIDFVAWETNWRHKPADE